MGKYGRMGEVASQVADAGVTNQCMERSLEDTVAGNSVFT